MLNPTYSPIILGQPMELASLLNRLQAISALPLLASADFEWGAGMRIAGATKFPRAMAFGAAGDPQLAYEAGKITGVESRGMGVHVDFGPVADVNNNPRNPVINIRSFGEDPARVGRDGRRLGARACRKPACSPRSSTFPGMATPTSIRISACRSSRIRARGSTRWSCRRSRPASPAAPPA